MTMRRRRRTGLGALGAVDATAPSDAAAVAKKAEPSYVVSGLLLNGGIFAIYGGLAALAVGTAVWMFAKPTTSAKGARAAKYGAFGVVGGLAAATVGFSGAAG